MADVHEPVKIAEKKDAPGAVPEFRSEQEKAHSPPLKWIIRGREDTSTPTMPPSSGILLLQGKVGLDRGPKYSPKERQEVEKRKEAWTMLDAVASKRRVSN
ncbi:hypothetical protein MTO96_025845 [Rhipicephalus appendiculatus]